MNAKLIGKLFAAITTAGLAGALCLGGSVTALASGEQVDEASYGYHAAQVNVENFTTAAAAEDTDGDTSSAGNAYADTSTYSYVTGQENGTAYADAEHTDAEDLVAAGVIESTEEIDAYAAAKHADISSRFDGVDGMTAEERHEHFSQYSCDGYAGDTLEELQDQGIVE